jgi:hypothetical protein
MSVATWKSPTVSSFQAVPECMLGSLFGPILVKAGKLEVTEEA